MRRAPSTSGLANDSREDQVSNQAQSEVNSAKVQIPNFRIGLGTDVHALVENRPLILGGVKVPFEKGLKGHSDADVVAHALIDAIFGATGLGDIGRHFPDTSEEYKGADSIELLKKAYALAKASGYRLSNVDMTITAERPKLAPHIPKMRQRLSEVVELAHDEFNIKAKTAEGMGPEGRGESMSCRAVVMMVEDIGAVGNAGAAATDQ
jgi:2-C-methyl-D-erythritol 2,4-cyclodiphosphate synthase